MNETEELRYVSEDARVRLEYNRREGFYAMAEDHMHPQHELYYLFQGERSYFIGDRVYPVRSGDLVFVPGGEVHKTFDAGEPGHERIVIYYDDAWFEGRPEEEAELLRSPFREGRRVLAASGPEGMRLERLLHELLRELQERQPGHGLAARRLAEQALLLAARLTRREQSRRQPEPSASPAAERMAAVARCISESYAEPLTLGGLSERFFLSPSHLSRSFKRHMGFAFTEYVALTRIKAAQRLLRETDERITAIAGQVGFDSFPHFEKVFKSIVRMPPRAYRASFRRS